MGGLVVVHEDASLLVVDKPAGVHTAPLRAGEPGTLLQMVIEAYPDVASVPGVKDIEPGLVHRIDRETSGLVVVARTAAAFAALREAFQAGSVRKGYVAACACGAAAAGKTIAIESRFAPFGPGRRMVRVVQEPGRGATAAVYRTQGEVTAVKNGRALVGVSLTRGFRHQVRAHLAFLGLPILGDPLYGVPAPAGREQRMYLHAARVEMPHPVTGAGLVVDSPAPSGFADLLEEDRHGLS